MVTLPERDEDIPPGRALWNSRLRRKGGECTSVSVTESMNMSKTSGFVHGGLDMLLEILLLEAINGFAIIRS